MHLLRSILICAAILTAVKHQATLAASSPVSISPVRNGDRFSLQWSAVPDVIYKVQSSSNLNAGAIWTTEEPVSTNQTGPIRWMAPESMTQTRFYRVLLPQPQIFSIEPSVLGTNGGIIYVVGQCLGTSGTLRLGPVNGGVEQPGSGDGHIMSVTLPPMAEGTYDASWLAGGQVVASASKLFSITAEVQPVGITQQLLEPPEESPAVPQITLKQKVVEHAVGEMREYGKEPAHVEVPNLRLFSGEVQISVVDLFIPGQGIDFVWGRTYRSRTGTNTAMGNGWDHSYNLSVQPLGGDILVHAGNGRDDRFDLQTNGTFSAPGFFCVGTLSNNIFRLTFADTGFWEFNPFDASAQAGKIALSHDCHDNVLAFSYDPQGRLTTIVDTLSRTNVVAYNSSGRIRSITDFSGRAFTYEYYTNGAPGGSDGDLAAAISPPVIGTPNGNDFPGGKTNRYTYSAGYANDRENHLLLTTINPKGQTTHTHVYQHNQTDLEFLRCVSSQSGTNTPVTFHALAQSAAPSNHFAVCRVIANDGLGNVSECFYDSRNRLVTLREFTGRATPGLPTTDVANRPTGKLRAEDPDFFESQWSWNADSLCGMYVNPRSIARQQWFQSDFDSNSNARKRGDLRVVRELAVGAADTDGDGLPDLAMRAWYLSYDPRFGSPDMRAWKGWDGTIKGRVRGGIMTKGDDVGRLSSAQVLKKVTVRGWNPEKKEEIVGNASAGGRWGKVDNSDSVSDTFDCFASGPRQTLPLDSTYNTSDSMRIFCPTETSGSSKPPRLLIDPRGNTFTSVLDVNGDVVHTETTDRKSGALIAADYNYKEHSRLAAITNAPDGKGYRRVDVAVYYTNGPQNGFLHEWHVDASGPTVLVTSYEYDDRGNVTRCVDPRTNDWLFSYNALDQCVRAQTPTNRTQRCITDFSYDANDNPVQFAEDVLDPNDKKLTTFVGVKAFDELDRCVTHALQVSPSHFLTNRFSYDANNNLTAVYSPEAVNGHDANNFVSLQYDERDLLFRTIRAPGSPDSSTCEFSYTTSGYVLERKKLKSGVVIEIGRCAYDGFDRCTGMTDPMSNVVTRAYDANNNMVYQRFDGETNDVPGSASNRRLAETHYEYDSLNRLTRTRAAFFDVASGLPSGDGESSSTLTYAPNGACLSVTDDNGHTTTLTYDTVGRMAVMTDAKTNSITCTYDACGNILSMDSSERSDLPLSAQEFIRTFAHDSQGRCILSMDNVGNTVQYAYDSLGHCVRRLDARGHLSGSAFDYLGRCTLTVADMDQDGLLDSAADIARTFVWDDNSRLVSCTDDNTNTTSYTYDSLNRWTLTQRPQGSSSHCTYDQLDNITTNVDANGTITVFTYDLNDRCIRKDITPAGGATSTTTFEVFAFDGLSRCALASNNVSVVQFAYDSLGHCVRSTQDGLATTCAFDGVGNCSSMTYPGGRTVTYTFDALDQSTSVSTSGGGLPPISLASFAYERPHQLGRILRANNASTRITWNGGVNPANTPGDFGWRTVSAINHQVANGGPVIDRRSFSYDPNQNKTVRAQTSPFFAGAPLGTNQFAYDSLNRMRTAVNTKGASVQQNDYLLDGNGNRQVVTNSGGAQFYSMNASVPPGDFQADQYTVTPFGGQLYDHNGNLVSLSTAADALQYRYDYADRLVEVDSTSTGVAAPVVSFAYDALGRRISKTTYPPSPAAPVTTQFVYDGADLDRDGILEERISGSVSRVYCWGRNDCYQEGGDNESVHRLVAMFNSSGQPRYFHCDDLGNALALTDSSGAILERYDYDDFGLPSFLSSDGVPLVDAGGQPLTASPQGNPFLFHGMFWDSEVRLYAETRPGDEDPAFIDPRTGRGVGRREPDSLVFNVINPRSGRTSSGLGQSPFTFSGENPWSCIYTEWAAGPRHYDDVKISPSTGPCGTDCDDNDPKRHRPTMRTSFALLLGSSSGSQCNKVRDELKTRFETGDIPTSNDFERGDKPTQSQFGTLIDSLLNRADDRYLLGLRTYDPAKTYLPGDTTIYNSSLYKETPKPTTRPKELTGHVTLIK